MTTETIEQGDPIMYQKIRIHANKWWRWNGIADKLLSLS